MLDLGLALPSVIVGGRAHCRKGRHSEPVHFALTLNFRPYSRYIVVLNFSTKNSAFLHLYLRLIVLESYHVTKCLFTLVNVQFK